MIRTIPWAMIVLPFYACSSEESPEDRAPAELTAWSWLLSSDEHDLLLDKVPEGAKVAFSIPRDSPLKTHSEGPGGIDTHGNFVPREKNSLVVDGGALESRLGPILRRATWGDWDEVWTDELRTRRSGWGYSLTQGEILLPRSSFESPPPDIHVANLFEIEPFGEGHVLVRLDPAKGHRLCFLEAAGGSRTSTAGFIGSRAIVDGVILERRIDGWYRGETRMSR